MATTLRIEPVDEADIAENMDIMARCFSGFHAEQRLGNTLDLPGRLATRARHLKAWCEHFEDTGVWPPIRCVHHDANTGRETTIASAEWFIYPDPTPRNDSRGANALLSASWLPSPQREELQQALKPTLDLREARTKGRGYGLLMYMATDPDWRRQGAASACVRWGLDRCKALGIPAYLEASDEGLPLYESLGFERVGEARMVLDGQTVDSPVLMWWPPGMRGLAEEAGARADDLATV